MGGPFTSQSATAQANEVQAIEAQAPPTPEPAVELQYTPSVVEQAAPPQEPATFRPRQVGVFILSQ